MSDPRRTREMVRLALERDPNRVYGEIAAEIGVTGPTVRRHALLLGYLPRQASGWYQTWDGLWINKRGYWDKAVEKVRAVLRDEPDLAFSPSALRSRTGVSGDGVRYALGALEREGAVPALRPCPTCGLVSRHTEGADDE